MLPILCLLAQANPTEAFVGETGQAVAAIREGVWGYEMAAPEAPLQRLVMIRKGDATRARHFDADKLDVEVATDPTSTLTVAYAERKFLRKTYPVAKPQPLPPLSEEVCDFRLHARWGLVFRANPDFTDVKVAREGDLETLSATWRKSGGAETSFVLQRDARTKLPTTLKIGNPGRRETMVRFSFTARKVEDAEMKIDSKGYAGFEEIKTQ